MQYDLAGWSTVLELMPTAMFVRDAEHRWVLVNRMGCTYFGLSVDDVIGRTDDELFPPEQAARMAAGDESVLRSHEVVESEESVTDPHGRVRTLITRKTCIDLDGEPHVLASVTDISDLRESEAYVRWLACHDALTGLSNRTALFSRIESAIAKAASGGARSVLFYLDLDGFKKVNDTWGHLAGDELLIQFGKRLREVVDAADTVARIGGDEFAVLVEERDDFDAETMAASFVKLAARPFGVLSTTAFVGTSVGVITADASAVAGGELARKADSALYEAKKRRNRYVLYNDELDAALAHRRDVERLLDDALVTGEGLSCHYQPIVRASDGKIIGLEALARWRHPRLGVIPPVQFIPVAEETGLIDRLGEWVLRTACARVVGVDDLFVAVNVSAVQLRDDGFADMVLGVLKRTGLPPSRLELEITETAIVNADGMAVRLLKQLRHVGVRVSLDDFGTGYSSLTLLKDLDVDKVKIDRSFVQMAPTAEDSAAIVRAVSNLGAALGLSVVAEGVETEQQRAFLCEAGCDELQGYLFSPGVPEDRIERVAQLLPSTGTAVSGG
ncbi:MAG: EAL domain-containing protein [Luteibacter sp.]|uniref:putative bifunctional diguanylate cyclase/phosphodiesterase n=1 Tax=unclassified Luteibacter TaxID=2620188 RepID=UPI00068FDB31|nr:MULTISPECIES: GGDEF domain-containing phosphodiesterase [unclassified Luteibacter]MDQ7998055.1 EAL domain-containing protein [Luteibacter sp.]MDQ8050782.1 EAL domain-containing protein [Luteibacter sp.]SKC04617.1 PAS domain S-box-containing protein/diguanylate cyclase (GGDEF) domain-containing protein [Luteibacter sp. 22Crub2.1]